MKNTPVTDFFGLQSNPLFQAIVFTGCKMFLAVPTQPLFVAKVHAQKSMDASFTTILNRTFEAPFKGVTPSMLREGKALFKYAGAYFGDKAANEIVAPLVPTNSAFHQTSLNLTRGLVGGLIEGAFATGINAWRTYSITSQSGSYLNFLREGDNGSIQSMVVKAFRGLTPTIIKQGATTGGTFAALDAVDNYIIPKLPKQMNPTSRKIVKAVASGVMVAVPLSLIDTVLVHIQKADAKKGVGFFRLSATMLAEHGPKALVRGAGFNTILITIGTTVNSVFFDAIKRNHDGGNKGRGA